MTNRRLLIISNGGLNKDLQGYDIDINNYVRFFSSSEGGAWNFPDDACNTETNSISRSDLHRILHNERVKNIDYWVIVFVGHGWSDPHGNDYIETRPEEYGDSDCAIADIRTAIGINTRCLMITDCCRGISMLEQGGTLPSVEMFTESETYGEHYRDACRELYDKAFMKIPTGAFFLGQACQFKQSAEGDDVDGGVYTSHLIKEAEDLRDHYKPHCAENTFMPMVFSFSYVHTLAKRKIIADPKFSQIPIFSGPRCNQPPFVVIGKKPRLLFG